MASGGRLFTATYRISLSDFPLCTTRRSLNFSNGRDELYGIVGGLVWPQVPNHLN
jgi:hypothetical protein